MPGPWLHAHIPIPRSAYPTLIDLHEFRFGRREVIYLLYRMLFVLPIFFLAVVIDRWAQDTESPNVEWFALSIVLAAIVATVAVIIRCSLLFPAVAVDSDRGLDSACPTSACPTSACLS